MPVKVKICGVTRVEDAEHVARAGADFIGLNFWPPSKRYLPPARSGDVAAAARAGNVPVVGVFVNASVDEICSAHGHAQLAAIQLHGDEDEAFAKAASAATGLPVWKALAADRADTIHSYDERAVEAVLLDTPSHGRGGSGTTFDWGLAHRAIAAFPQRRFVVAGGLTPANVAAAITATTPWGVDTASGVEAAPGIKDAARVTAFIAAARAAG
ncbi:MAG: N-(5'-phosphoribosyl)anthranilate isomerase [Kofleriaceae bacterium]